MSYLTRRKILIGIGAFTCISVIGVAPAQAKKGIPIGDMINFGARVLSRSRRSRNCPPDNKDCRREWNWYATTIPVSLALLWGLFNFAKDRNRLKAEPSADPIEQELNQLRSQEKELEQLGAEFVKPVKTPRSAVKTQTKWECFRSGPVGPYTKEELRSIQKITAKTNVRRVGETDWTRAGQIPELAEFLTVKP